MEKQTKILLGVGAIIAAYLILKPKKAVAPTPAPIVDNKVTGGYPCPDGTIDYNYTDTGFMSPCVGHGKIKAAVMPADWDLLQLQKQTSF